MADVPSPVGPAGPPNTSIAQKRPLDNADEASFPRTKPAREKKDSWRKKEALQTGDYPAANKSGKQTGTSTPKAGDTAKCAQLPALMSYRLPAPQALDYYGHRAPPTVLQEDLEIEGEYYAVNDHPINRRGYRYTPCEASKQLPSLAYRATEYEPFTPRISFEDMNGQMYVNEKGSAVTQPKGWRMARANVAVREGDWYYEVKILNGISDDGKDGGHVRIGLARREAPLDAPVGFDAYSYGLRDQNCQKVHLSRPKDFKPDETFKSGDVIGFHISLPPLHLQRTISGDPIVQTGDVIRDRIPIRFKNQLWFEHFEYQSTKQFEDLANPTPSGKSAPQQPKTLPGSYIRVYKNGKYLGTPFEDLYAFLPPASQPIEIPNVGGRPLDDGSLGYYPAVSVFKGGAAEVNFGPEWLHKPEELGEEVRGLWERYNEQIAEDVVYDLVDEVDLLFTTGGLTGDAESSRTAHGKEEIKEMVMED